MEYKDKLDKIRKTVALKEIMKLAQMCADDVTLYGSETFTEIAAMAREALGLPPIKPGR